MRVMGIDPSTRMGIAVVSGDSILTAREVEFKKLTGFERIDALMMSVHATIKDHQPEAIFIEEVIVGHASSAITIIQIGSFIRYSLWQEGIQYWDVHPSTLKKFAVGDGRAKKEQIMMGVLKRWGYESPTNNVADAVALSKFGQAAFGQLKITAADKALLAQFHKKNPGLVKQ